MLPNLSNHFYTTLVVMFALGICFPATAQVGIGTDSPATGTILHVEDLDGTEKSGVLFTKVHLTDLSKTDPLPENTRKGTLVYNINEDLQRGYFYWTVTKWQRLNATIGSMAKFINSSNHTDNNLNVVGATKADIFGLPATKPAFNDAPELYQRPNSTPSSNPINRRFLDVKEAGRYQITVNLSMEADPTNGGLSQIEARLEIDNTEVGPFFKSSEMKASDGSIRGSISFTQTLFIPANSRLSVSCRRATNSSGAVYLSDSGTSSFFIEKLF
ncbi:hypothetical protein [Nonlabens marinus]|uniref:Uncharacterized protein n=1 Tax=Nonlabens marinus S1-08 TaxID=1454201 RepID=W8VXB6_9FLAO|nr:hypothetical protein [Nonlabens marinus]BAO55642.1 hypothetical protein NMS_1633 [Nonlabens marinus S1-08]